MSRQIGNALVFLFIIISFSLHAQPFQPVFPGLSGQTLKDSLVGRFKPIVVLDYNHARDTLYSKVIAKDDDSLRCIYSGYTLYLDPTQDPTQYVYHNGAIDGMNAEHAYPQSKGAATGNGHSDMHHLYPAKSNVNDARSDKPYAEIQDNLVQKWYYKNEILTTVPTQHKDLYAESYSDAFEPRESVKGDVARAIMYFYTMYKTEADLADPDFFLLQRLTLCAWHEQDPPDSAELKKTMRIAHWQEGKPNPYILDCTLPYRTWCPEMAPGCIMSAASEAFVLPIGMRVSPNPATGPVRLDLVLPFEGALEIKVLTATGQEVNSSILEKAPAGAFGLPLDLGRMSGSQVAFVQVRLIGKEHYAVKTLPVIIREP